MARFDDQSKVLYAKIVYYGPPLSGKTTNLIALHGAADPEGRTRLFSLNTREDRTLFFDVMPLEVGKILNYTLRLQIFTVPGQVHYKATRRMVLNGADVCVFVADSAAGATGSNLASLMDFRDNLEANGMDFETVPLVYQYNKRDLADALPVEELEESLNIRGTPYLTCVASDGEGVVETLQCATERLVHNLLDRFGTNGEAAATPESAADLVGSIFQKFLDPGERVVKRAVPEWVRTYPKATDPAPAERPIEVYGDLSAPPMLDVDPPGDDEVQVLDPEQLLEQSLCSQMQIAEQFGALEAERDCLEEAVDKREAEADHAFDQLVEAEERHDDLLSALSHDLKAPLESLAATVDSLAEAQDPEMARSRLDLAREESQRLSQLVRDILTARRGVVEGVSFERVLEVAREACQDRFDRKNLTLEATVEENLPDVEGDQAKLAYALKNVLLTAGQASPAGSSVRLRADFKEMALERKGKADTARRFVAVQVRDFGEGFPRAIWEKIFEDAPDGTPSSMATSREILRRCGGFMQVKSRSGKGNLISLYIPVADTAAAPLTVDHTA